MFRNSNAFLQLIDRQYDEQYRNRDFKIGTTLNIRLPVDYVVSGPDVVLRVGDGLFSNVTGQIVAFEVEGTGDDGRPWSVLVRGLARSEPDGDAVAGAPRPRVTKPGRHLVRIQAHVVTGRRLGAET